MISLRNSDRVANGQAKVGATPLWLAPIALLLAISVYSSAVHADLVAHTAPVRDIVISKDGKRALTAGFDDL